jgi:hypothetical protein
MVYGERCPIVRYSRTPSTVDGGLQVWAGRERGIKATHHEMASQKLTHIIF